MIVTANRTQCVLLASDDIITQKIDAHLARAKRATVSVGKHLGVYLLVHDTNVTIFLTRPQPQVGALAKSKEIMLFNRKNQKEDPKRSLKVIIII